MARFIENINSEWIHAQLGHTNAHMEQLKKIGKREVENFGHGVFRKTGMDIRGGLQALLEIQPKFLAIGAFLLLLVIRHVYLQWKLQVCYFGPIDIFTSSYYLLILPTG